MGILDAPPADPRRTGKPALTAAMFGDSITNRNGSGPIVRGSETTLYFETRGMFHIANMLLGHPFDFVVNAGVGGDTTTNMLARITDITTISPRPAWLFGLAGINDQGALNPTQSIANLKAIFTAAFAAGYQRIVWGAVTPDRGNTGQRWVIDQINAWLRSYAAVTPGFILVNWTDPFLDPTTGAAVQTPVDYTMDGLHPSPLGAAVLGQYLADVLRTEVPGLDRLHNSNSSVSLGANPMMTGSVSGLATNWNQTGFTAYKMPRYDGRSGDWQMLVSGATGGSSLFQDVAPSGSTYAPGDVLYAELEFETDDDWKSITKFELSLEFSSTDTGINTAVNRSVDMLQNTGVPALSFNPRRGVLRTPIITVPSQVTAANTGKVRAILRFDGIGSIRVGRFATVKKVTP